MDARRMSLQKNKRFLKGLYLGNKVQNLARLEVASKYQISNLLNVIHYICKGDIKIKKENFDAIKKAKRIDALYSLRNASEVKIFKTKPIESQILFLKKFASLYVYILHPLFNKY